MKQMIFLLIGAMLLVSVVACTTSSIIDRDKAAEIVSAQFTGTIESVEEQQITFQGASVPAWEVTLSDVRGLTHVFVTMDTTNTAGEVILFSDQEFEMYDDEEAAFAGVKGATYVAEPRGTTNEAAGKIAVEQYGGTIEEIQAKSVRGVPAWRVSLLSDDGMSRMLVFVDKLSGDVVHAYSVKVN